MVAFDNDQVVGKSLGISTDDKVKSSCETSICTLDPANCRMSSLRLLFIPKTGLTTLDLYKNYKISGIRMVLILTQFMIHIINCYATNLINICPICIKNRFLVT